MTTTPRTPWIWVAAELLLVITTVGGVRMLQRLFEDTSFLAPLVFLVLVCHGVLIATRWLGFNALTSAAASLVAVALGTVATQYSSSALALVLPTPATLTQVGTDLETARDVFNTLQTPVPPVPGFVVISALCFWALIVAADWAAFRLFTPGQALVPMLTVTVFVSLLGVPDNRTGLTTALLISGTLFLLAHRSAGRAAQGIWLGRGPAGGYLALMISGGLVAIAVVAVGVLGGPSVPGADADPLVEVGGEGRRESEPIEVVSPLVQIQPRIVDQTDAVMFNVETNERAYWRFAALDLFDGALWRSQGQFRSADDNLEIAYPLDGVPTTTLTSTFDLEELNVVWAPAAYLPVGLQMLDGSADLNYEAESATFIVDTGQQSVSNGLLYRVQSSIPNFTPDLLRRLPLVSNDTIDDRYLDLPNDFSQMARDEATRITDGLGSEYDKALALQRFFRDNFTYDLDVAAGHDIVRIEDFLEVRRGYCEQFAGTFAAMARSVGIPARIAIGFTQGEQDPSDPTRFVVRGKHAHAWPEVWLAGAGWVPFEPTPGRGIPNSSEYTGVAEAQDESGGENAGADVPQPEVADQTANQAAAAAPTPTPVPAAAAPEPEPVEPATEVAVDPPRQLMPLIMLGSLALLVVLAFAIPALKRSQARRRHERLAGDTRRRVTLAWVSTVDRFEALGHGPKASETLLEYGDRVQEELPATSPTFGELSALTVDAAYGPTTPTSAKADLAEALARVLARVIDDERSVLARSLDAVNPRPLLRLQDPVLERAEALATGSGIAAV